MTLNIRSVMYCLLLTLVQIIYILVPSVDFLQFRNPTVSGKFIIFSFIIEITAFLFLIRSIIVNKTFHISLIDVLLIIVLGYITLNRYFLQPIHGFSIRYYELLGLSTLYLILRSVKSKHFYYSVFIAVIIGADLQIIIGTLQLYGLIKSNNNFLKVTGSFFNSGPYACYLATVFPIALYLLKNNKTTGFIKCILIFNILGCISLIPALKSRASYLAVLCTLILIYRHEILSFTTHFFKKRIIKYILPFILLISVAGMIFFLFTFKKDSSHGRYLVLKATSSMIIDKPILGFGYDRFRSNYMNYQAAYFTRHPDKSEAILASNTVYAFNEPLQFFVENGIIGCIMVVLFVYLIFKYAKKQDDHTSLAKIGLTSIFVFSLFSYPSEILPIKLLVFLYIAILAAYYRGTFRLSLSIKKYSPVWLISGLTLFYLTVRQTVVLTQAYLTWEDGYTKADNSNFIDSKKKYQSVYPIFEANGDFLADYGEILFLTQNYEESIKISEAAKKQISNTMVENTLGNCQTAIQDYTGAESSYLIANNMTPNSFYNKHLLLKLYQISDQHIKANNIAKEILTLPVKIPSESVNKIRQEAALLLEEQNTH